MCREIITKYCSSSNTYISVFLLTFFTFLSFLLQDFFLFQNQKKKNIENRQNVLIMIQKPKKMKNKHCLYKYEIFKV